MIKTTDILNRIQNDFGENAREAFSILEAALLKYEHLNNDRIIRCIIYLSEKKLEKLKKCIHQAMEDPRDVMLWAEYINLKDGETPKQVRDFNKTFEKCEIDFKS